MKKINLLMGLLLISSVAVCQIGIGTLTPNSHAVLDLTSSAPNHKGLLIPRMTATERTAMSLSAPEAGMMVYQTTVPKGLYTYDGAAWLSNSPVETGSLTGATLRWDGTKWGSATNLFNQGTTIGIGITSPNTMLHIHTTSITNNRIQLTNASTGSLATDGLLFGNGNTVQPGVAHLIQQENKPLWFGTNSVERMRIDSAGRVGINQVNPSTTLDVNGSLKVDGAVTMGGSITTNGAMTTNGPVTSSGTVTTTGALNAVGPFTTTNTFNATGTVTTTGTVNSTGTFNANGQTNLNGTFKLGNNGSVLQNIIRTDVSIDPPLMHPMDEWAVEIPIANTSINAVVYASPNMDLAGYSICYARISSPGTLKVKIMYLGPAADSDLGWITLRVAVIQ